MPVVLKRAYAQPAEEDGQRVLVDRLWPRGVAKSALKIDLWLKDLAPSTELRRWFGHDPARWLAFRERYRQELKTPAAEAALTALAQRAATSRVTLVYSAHDEVHNQAVVLKELLEQRTTMRAPDEGEP